MYYFIFLIVLIGLDQLVKLVIRMNMDLNQSVPVLQDIFHISYIQNNGAAFSMLQGQQALLIGVTSIVEIGLLVFIWINRKKVHWILLISLALVAGGGIGNLIDRIWLGAVVDFLDFRFFPIFNLADIFVVCGSGILFIYLFYVEPKTVRERNLDERGRNLQL
jgi:signal peptidase II